MNIKFKSSLSSNKTLTVLSLLCLLFGAVGIVAGDVVLPIIIATLSLIFLFDQEKRVFSKIAVIGLLIFNAVGFFFNTVFLYGPEGIILAFLLLKCLRTKKSKAETAVMMTGIVSLFIVATFVIIPFSAGGADSLSDVAVYYEELISALRDVFVSSAMEIYKPLFEGSGMEISESLVTSLFNQQLSMIISYVVIVAFATVGITMKIFEAILSRLAERKDVISNWRFMTSNVFAYFYVGLMILAIFSSSSGGVLGIAIGNLYNIFMIVYAYVGFNYALALLSTRLKPSFAIILMVVASILALSLVLQLFAAFGVLFTIRKNRELAPGEEA